VEFTLLCRPTTPDPRHVEAALTRREHVHEGAWYRAPAGCGSGPHKGGREVILNT
jgi:hypothetical protein